MYRLSTLSTKTYFKLIFDFQISNVNSLWMLDIFRYKFYSHVSFAEMLNTSSFITRVFFVELFFFSARAIILNVGIDGATRGVEAL